MKNKQPTGAIEKDPAVYFETLLNPLEDNGWLWSTDDVDVLMNGFAGTP